MGLTTKSNRNSAYFFVFDNIFGFFFANQFQGNTFWPFSGNPLCLMLKAIFIEVQMLDKNFKIKYDTAKHFIKNAILFFQVMGFAFFCCRFFGLPTVDKEGGSKGQGKFYGNCRGATWCEFRKSCVLEILRCCS